MLLKWHGAEYKSQLLKLQGCSNFDIRHYLYSSSEGGKYGVSLSRAHSRAVRVAGVARRREVAVQVLLVLRLPAAAAAAAPPAAGGLSRLVAAAAQYLVPVVIVPAARPQAHVVMTGVCCQNGSVSMKIRRLTSSTARYQHGHVR